MTVSDSVTYTDSTAQLKCIVYTQNKLFVAYCTTREKKERKKKRKKKKQRRKKQVQ